MMEFALIVFERRGGVEVCGELVEINCEKEGGEERVHGVEMVDLVV